MLIAFGLIAAPTVGASWLSLIRFNQTDAVMRRVTDESLPLVKLSLSMETKAAEVVESADDLSESQTQDQTERMARVSRQIDELWKMLGGLQALGAESETVSQIRDIVSTLAGEIGAIGCLKRSKRN